MSESENQEAPEVVESAEVEQVEVEAVNPAEAKARSKGWVGLDEWTEQGKDPDDWTTFKSFNEKGDFIAQINRLKTQTKEFDQRLSQSNELWKAQLEMQKAQFVNQRDDAIDLADKDAVKALDKQISDIDKQMAATVAPKIDVPTPEDVATENAYLKSLDSEPKRTYAEKVASQVLASDPTLKGQDLVDAVDVEIQKHFPATNPRRASASVTDSKKAAASKSKDNSLDSLSKDDLNILKMMRNYPSFKNKSDSEILKAIEDSKR